MIKSFEDLPKIGDKNILHILSFPPDSPALKHLADIAEGYPVVIDHQNNKLSFKLDDTITGLSDPENKRCTVQTLCAALERVTNKMAEDNPEIKSLGMIHFHIMSALQLFEAAKKRG